MRKVKPVKYWSDECWAPVLKKTGEILMGACLTHKPNTSPMESARLKWIQIEVRPVRRRKKCEK